MLFMKTQMLRAFALWLVFSAAVLYGTYLVLSNPEDVALARYFPLAVIIAMPLAYCLCAYVGYLAGATATNRGDSV